MAHIDAGGTTLTVTVPGSQPSVDASAGPPIGFMFNSPSIDASAAIKLVGAAGENVAGWTLGFIQLKYIGTDHARYRGATPHEGSALVSKSNKILCRDTDKDSAEVWYDSLNAGGTTGPAGTNKLAAGTKLGADGTLVVPAHLFDQPRRWRASVRVNDSVASKPNNFLSYAVVELLFCTMLVAREPGGAFHMLRHYYWNVIWEQTFKRDPTGAVVLDKKIRLQQNLQHGVHGGNPHDPKFSGREYDTSLPVSNTVSRREPHVIESANWSQG